MCGNGVRIGMQSIRTSRRLIHVALKMASTACCAVARGSATAGARVPLTASGTSLTTVSTRHRLPPCPRSSGIQGGGARQAGERSRTAAREARRSGSLNRCCAVILFSTIRLVRLSIIVINSLKRSFTLRLGCESVP